MSIACQLAAAAARPTSLPTVVPSAVPSAGPAAGEPAWVAWLVLGWAVVAVAAARALGAFRRHGIVGPERLAGDESAWGLLAVLGGGLIAAVVGGTAVAAGLASVRRHHHGGPSPDLTLLIVGSATHLTAAAVMLVLLRERRPNHAGLHPIGLAVRGIPVAVAGGTAALFVIFPLVVLASAGVEAAYRAFHLQRARSHPVLELLGPSTGGP